MTNTNLIKHTSANPIQQKLIGNFNQSLLREISSLKIDTVLDVGCGEGFTLKLLNDNKLGKNYFGTDNNLEAIDYAQKMCPWAKFGTDDIYHLPFKDDQFDLVICTEVLEHLVYPRKAINEIMRVSKKYLVISVPNEPWFQLTNFIRGKYLSRLGNHPEHINHWSASSIKSLINEYELKISSVSTPYPWTIIKALK